MLDIKKSFIQGDSSQSDETFRFGERRKKERERLREQRLRERQIEKVKRERRISDKEAMKK